MKKIIFKLALVSGLLVATTSVPAQTTTTPEAVVDSYAQYVQTSYSAALEGAYNILAAVNIFIANPTQENLDAARLIWTEARKAYSLTEVFRFYSGPIDADDGPEGLINAWPLDEVYIDYVIGNKNAGIVQDTVNYPLITRQVLVELNENGGEKNISTGYHAIEFLLWGQDLNPNGPGNRPVSDYIVGQNAFAERRAQYLRLVSEMLVEDLEGLMLEWNKNDASTYAASFVSPADSKASLEKIFTGVIRLAGEELSQERMFVAYDTMFQEDEHSCFSDTTHNDILYNFLGIRYVIENNLADADLYRLIQTRDPILAGQILTKLDEVEALLRSVPAPFDQAIISPIYRPVLLEAITALEDLAELNKEAALLFGITIE